MLASRHAERPAALCRDRAVWRFDVFDRIARALDRDLLDLLNETAAEVAAQTEAGAETAP